MEYTEIRFRNKITFVQFALSVGIVYQHTVWNYQGSQILNVCQASIFYLLQTCVPFFFMISGYLFFRTYEPKNAKRKIISRGKTLLIPYIIWNTIYTIFTIVLTRIGLITHSSIHSNLGGVFVQLLNSEFSPLWFIKYLMVFTLVSPVMYHVFRRKYIGILSIGLMLILNISFYYAGVMSVPINVNENTFIMLNYQYIFYAVGAYGALNFKGAIEKPSQRIQVIAIAVLVVVLMLGLYLRRYGDAMINHSFRLLFSISLWFSLDLINEFPQKSWMRDSFFLYVSHLMVLQCSQRICDIVIEKIGVLRPSIYVVEYCMLPILVIAFLIVVAEGLKKHASSLYGIVAGNRI